MVKTLGVYFQYNKKILNVEICLKLAEKNEWNVGIVDIALFTRPFPKTLALAKVVYLIAAMCASDWVINEMNKDFAFYSEIERVKMNGKF